MERHIPIQPGLTEIKWSLREVLHNFLHANQSHGKLSGLTQWQNICKIVQMVGLPSTFEANVRSHAKFFHANPNKAKHHWAKFIDGTWKRAQVDETKPGDKTKTESYLPERKIDLKRVSISVELFQVDKISFSCETLRNPSPAEIFPSPQTSEVNCFGEWLWHLLLCNHYVKRPCSSDVVTRARRGQWTWLGIFHPPLVRRFCPIAEKRTFSAKKLSLVQAKLSCKNKHIARYARTQLPSVISRFYETTVKLGFLSCYKHRHRKNSARTSACVRWAKEKKL